MLDFISTWHDQTTKTPDSISADRPMAGEEDAKNPDYFQIKDLHVRLKEEKIRCPITPGALEKALHRRGLAPEFRAAPGGKGELWSFQKAKDLLLSK